MKIRIGSRGSDLALWQANFVKDQLTELGHEVSIKIIITKGDSIQNLSFDKIEGKGFFTKEIEEALLNNEIDLAVHSHKDLETTNPEGLIIGAVSYREDPSDVLILHEDAFDDFNELELKENAVVGTSSARRRTQLMRLRPDIEIRDLRGNVPTRIQKLQDRKYDGIVLAAAGLARLDLNLDNLIVRPFTFEEMVPAPAQGVLGLQIREKDTELAEVLQEINHPDVAELIAIEREVLRSMEGGCQLPLGVHCIKEDDDNFIIYTGFAPSKNEIAKISVYETDDLEGMASLIVSDLKHWNEEEE